MAISTFAELKTAIANWLEDDTLTSRIPEFISLAEDEIRAELRVRAMEASTNLTVNAQTVSLPTRFVQVKRLYLSTDPIRHLEYMTPDMFWQRYLSSTTSKPEAYTIEGENFVFGPSPDASYTGKLLYYQSFAALSADGDTNWILTNARGLLLYGALKQAAAFLEGDERVPLWNAAYEQLLRKLHLADARDRHGGTLASRSQVSVA